MGYDAAFAEEMGYLESKLFLVDKEGKRTEVPGVKESFMPRSLAIDKTIYDVNKMNETLVQKVLQMEIDYFKGQNPDYELADIKVAAKGNGSVTYNLVFKLP